MLITGNWTNGGTVETVSGGSISSGGSFTNAGTITDPDGYAYLTGTWNNSGSKLGLNNSLVLYLEGGTISGGAVTTTGGMQLVGTALGGTLAGVTLAGTLEMASPLLPTNDAG